MAEITVSPVFGPNVLPSGDTWFANNAAIPSSLFTYDPVLRWGREGDKSPANQHVFLKYDLSAVPFLATIVRAKLTVKAAFGNAIDMNGRVSAVTRDGKWDPDSFDEIKQRGLGLQASIHDTAGLQVAVAATSQNFNTTHQSDMGIGPFGKGGTGFGGFGQAMKLTTGGNGLLGQIRFRIGRSATTSPGTNVWAELWSTTGDLAPRTLVALLATSDLVSFDSLPTANTIFSFLFSGAQQVAIATGNVFGVLLKMSTAFDDGDPSLRVYQLSTFNGFVNNAFYYGPCAGFSPQVYPEPTELQNFLQYATVGDIPLVIPMVADTVYTLGDAAYSPSQAFPFAPIIQEAVNDPNSPESNWNGKLCLRLGVVAGSPDGGERYLWSQDQPGETGPQLTVEWTAKRSRHFRRGPLYGGPSRESLVGSRK